MQYKHSRLWPLNAILPLLSLGAPRTAGAAWKKIFNGKNLDGWKAPDMSYFSVKTAPLLDRQPASTIHLKTSLLSGRVREFTTST